MKKDYIQYDKFFPCECDSHFLRVEKYTEEPDIYLSKYQMNRCDSTFFSRVKLAFGYIFKPNKYEIHGDIIFNMETAKELGQYLLNITAEKPKDMEYGK